MTNLLIIESSWGRIVVDPVTGYVDPVASNYLPDREGEQTHPISNIHRFDVDEWRRAWPGETLAGTEQDILDFGYWSRPGDAYEPPVQEWRDECRNQKSSSHEN
jgi:hypothetical protein